MAMDQTLNMITDFHISTTGHVCARAWLLPIPALCLSLEFRSVPYTYIRSDPIRSAPIISIYFHMSAHSLYCILHRWSRRSIDRSIDAWIRIHSIHTGDSLTHLAPWLWFRIALIAHLADLWIMHYELFWSTRVLWGEVMCVRAVGKCEKLFVSGSQCACSFMS